jgi:hypothetical protein
MAAAGDAPGCPTPERRSDSYIGCRTNGGDDDADDRRAARRERACRVRRPERELAALDAAVAAAVPPFVAAFVQGRGGIGKTRLLQAVLADASPDVRTFELDGRDV